MTAPPRPPTGPPPANDRADAAGDRDSARTSRRSAADSRAADQAGAPERRLSALAPANRPSLPDARQPPGAEGPVTNRTAAARRSQNSTRELTAPERGWRRQHVVEPAEP